MSTIDLTHWGELKRIHEQVAAAPADARDALLVELAGDDPRLLEDARSLLSSCEEAEASMPVPDAETFEAWFEEPGLPALEQAFGPFRLVRELGRGGMGVVFEAEEAEPARRVALKILRSGPGSASDRERFAREARVLGNLTHPGIAALYGAGTHESAAGERVPYLVMELVRSARPITQYVKEASLSSEACLALFLEVAEAVAAGHQRGIIHRDLKPDNVLVGDDGRPKIVDFGIARVTAPDLDPGQATATGVVMGTLGYVAPEQLEEGHGADDVRMDVYALGVLLYEMLTGRRPIEVDTKDVLAAVRATLEQPPTPPTRHVPGMARDLVLILSKALAKEPDRRYASVEALASDVRAFLEDQPIRARPPSWTYQLRLLTRRNRVGVGAAAVVVLALGLATWFSLRAADREAEQRKAAEKAEGAARQSAERAMGLLAGSQELVQTLFTDLYDDLLRVPRTLPARLALVERVEEGTRALRLHAEDDPRLLRIAGLVQLHAAGLNYRLGGDHLGRPDAALAALGRAKEAFELLLARGDVATQQRMEDRRHLAQVVGDQASVLAFQGETESAMEHAKRAVGMLEQLAAEDEASVAVRLSLASYRTRLALMEYEARDADAAIARLKAALDTLPKDVPEDSREAATTHGTRGYAEALLGEIYRDTGRLPAARRRLEASLASFEAARAIHPDDPWVNSRLGLAQGELGVLAFRGGDLDRAEGHLEAALALGRAQVKQNPEDRRARQGLQVDLARMATLREAQKQMDAAIAFQTESVAISKQLAAEQPDALFAQMEWRIGMNHLGGMLFRAGRGERAVAVFQDAHDLARRLLDAHPNNAKVRLAHAEALDALGIGHWSSAQGKAPDAQRAHLEKARDLFQASLDAHEALKQEGLLPATHEAALAQIAKKVEICEQNLSKLLEPDDAGG